MPPGAIRGLLDDGADAVRHELRLIEKLELRSYFRQSIRPCASRARGTSSARPRQRRQFQRSATLKGITFNRSEAGNDLLRALRVGGMLLPDIDVDF